MNGPAKLDRLAELCGIAGEYADIWGNTHRAPPEAKRALLGALGWPADTGEELERAIAELESEPWTRVLPPVLVTRDAADIRVPISLPASASGAIDWTLIREDGRRVTGRARPSELEELGRAAAGGRRYVRRVLSLGGAPHGYHRLELRCGAISAGMSLIAAPGSCHEPQALRRGRGVWGPAVQLYSVRSGRNWGAGDLTDAVAVAEFAAESGAGIVGLNPLHALFPHNPAHCSPYSPSSRRFLNVLYVDPEAVPDFAECGTARKAVRAHRFQVRLRACRSAELVDYPELSALKLPVLEKLYAHFRRAHLEPGSERGRAFRAFQSERGRPLRRHALFEALQERFHKEDRSVHGWTGWPEAYRDPDAPEVREFESESLERVEFFEYLQWNADLQLAAASRRSNELGMGLGLYLDLAVGVDQNGAEVWSDRELFALGARVGAPPDEFNRKGQDWGLPPMIPSRLRERGYVPIIDTLRRNMRHAGALRIDHVMGLMRLFCVPPGGTAEDGAYVHYPFDDLLGILALESRRNECMVIGEDLGTVPDEVREKLGPLGVLSYRLLYFEKDREGVFKPPAGFRERALASVTTHDLPTLAGYWRGEDIEVRARLDLFPSEELREAQAGGRERDRRLLLEALEREGLLPEGAEDSSERLPAGLAPALHRYLARSRSRVMVFGPEDAFGQTGQANLPGTVDEHPNWRRKLSARIEEWRADEGMSALTRALREERGACSRPGAAGKGAAAGPRRGKTGPRPPRREKGRRRSRHGRRR